MSISKVAATALQIYFRFSVLVTYRISRSIRTPNFAKTAQSAAEVLLFPVSENKRPPYRNVTFGYHFDVFDVTLSACDSASAYQILRKSHHPQPSYEVISIFKMAAVSHVGVAVR